MKKTNLTGFLISILFGFFLFYIAATIAYQSPAYKWYLTGKYIEDPNYYNGGYYFINDSMKIVSKKWNNNVQYLLYINDKETDVDMFQSICPTKFEMLNHLQWDYYCNYKKK